MGEEVEKRARQALALNRGLTTSAFFFRASMYYQMGERFRQPKDQKGCATKLWVTDNDELTLPSDAHHLRFRFHSSLLLLAPVLSHLNQSKSSTHNLWQAFFCIDIVRIHHCILTPFTGPDANDLLHRIDKDESVARFAGEG